MYHYAANNPVRYTDPDGRELASYTRRLIHKFAVTPKTIERAQNGTFPNKSVGFSFDGQYYHATFDCWQEKAGYHNIYDWGFNHGTNMQTVKFPFKSGEDSLVIWVWKGDYLNMGAGCELGIYNKCEGILGDFGFYEVDKNLAFQNINIILAYKGRKAGYFDGKHWWGTTFNPSMLNVESENLRALFKICFGENEQMYKDFKAEWNKKGVPLWFDDENKTVNLYF